MKVLQNEQTKVKKATSSMFKYRLAEESEAVTITGYGHNGMTPFYMSENKLPILLAKEITEMKPAFFYLGAGKVNIKIGVSVDDFKRHFGEDRVTVADVY